MVLYASRFYTLNECNYYSEILTKNPTFVVFLHTQLL
jgi:hypothetical protein